MQTLGTKLQTNETRALRAVAPIAAGLSIELAVIGMRQYGVIRRLPDVPLRGFDANADTTSRAAYPFGIPDSALALVGLGGTETRGRSPTFDVLLGGATAIGAAGVLYYLDTMRRQRTLCAYCLVVSAGMFAMAAIAVPRAVRTVARWFAR